MCTLWAQSVRSQIWGKNTRQNFVSRKWIPRRGTGSGEIRAKRRSALLLKPGQRQRPFQNIQRNENSWVIAEHQCTCSAKGFELRRNGDSAEIQDLYKGGDGQRRSANKRGNTSVRSRSWPLRDSATTRRSACYSIAWKTLRRPRIFLRVGQLSQTTVDQRGEDKLIQNEQFRTASFSRLSATSGSFSSSTSTFQELSSTSPAQERSDGLAPTNWWASHPKQTQTTVNGVSEKSCEDLSWNHRTSIPRRSETNGIAERAVRRVKEGTFCIAAIRIGWKMVGCFNGMLFLSATCPRPLGSRGNSANNSFWSNGWISPDFSKRSIKTSSIWRESFSGVQRSRVECGKEIFW